MIHYSSIQDAWGKKNMFKNNKFTNIYTRPLADAQIKMCHTSTPEIISPEIISPEIISPEIISPEIISPEIISPKIISPEIISPEIISPEIISPEIISPKTTLSQQNANELFSQNNCKFMEHLQNCPFCKNKERFVTEEKPISTINIFGFEINITKDVLKILFVIILFVIFILLLRLVNVSFNQSQNKYLNLPNEELLKLLAHIKYININSMI